MVMGGTTPPRRALRVFKTHSLETAMKNRIVILAGFAGGLALAAVAPAKVHPKAAEVSKTVQALAPNQAALALFAGKCAKCHGFRGDGRGKLAGLMDPKPTNFTDPAWQKKWTDAQILDAITYGGKSAKEKIGKKMPSFSERPKLTNTQIESLLPVVRSFSPRKDGGK